MSAYILSATDCPDSVPTTLVILGCIGNNANLLPIRMSIPSSKACATTCGFNGAKTPKSVSVAFPEITF